MFYNYFNKSLQIVTNPFSKIKLIYHIYHCLVMVLFYIIYLFIYYYYYYY